MYSHSVGSSSSRESKFQVFKLPNCMAFYRYPVHCPDLASSSCIQWSQGPGSFSCSWWAVEQLDSSDQGKSIL